MLDCWHLAGAEADDSADATMGVDVGRGVETGVWALQDCSACPALRARGLGSEPSLLVFLTMVTSYACLLLSSSMAGVLRTGAGPVLATAPRDTISLVAAVEVESANGAADTGVLKLQVSAEVGDAATDNVSGSTVEGAASGSARGSAGAGGDWLGISDGCARGEEGFSTGRRPCALAAAMRRWAAFCRSHRHVYVLPGVWSCFQANTILHN